MHHLRTALSAALVALALAAPSRSQTSANEVMLDAGIVRYAWRGEVGNDANGGELHQAFEELSWRGLGDVGSSCEITGFRARNFQDQDSSTAENYRWLVRIGTDTGGPDVSASGIFYRSAPLQLAPAMGSGAKSYAVTTLLQSPVQGGCSQFFTVGCELGARPNWPLDGQSVWVSSKLNGVDDHLANAKATDSAWQRIGSKATASHPFGDLTWRLGFLTPTPSLALGNSVTRAPQDRFGKGGLFPMSGQGLKARLIANGRAGQVAILLLSPNFSPLPVAFFPGARVWIDIGGFLGPITAAPITTKGSLDVADFLIAPRIPAMVAGDFCWQALLLDTQSSTLSMSNAVRSRL